MCHVNVLKNYIDRDSSSVKPVSVLNFVPLKTIDSDFACEFVNLKNTDSGPVILHDTKILQFIH